MTIDLGDIVALDRGAGAIAAQLGGKPAQGVALLGVAVGLGTTSLPWITGPCRRFDNKWTAGKSLDVRRRTYPRI